MIKISKFEILYTLCGMPVLKRDTGYYLKERGLGTLVFDK